MKKRIAYLTAKDIEEINKINEIDNTDKKKLYQLKFNQDLAVIAFFVNGFVFVSSVLFTSSFNFRGLPKLYGTIFYGLQQVIAIMALVLVLMVLMTAGKIFILSHKINKKLNDEVKNHVGMDK